MVYDVHFNVNSQCTFNSDQSHPFIDSRNIIENFGTDVCWNRLAKASHRAGSIKLIKFSVAIEIVRIRILCRKGVCRFFGRFLQD